MTNDEVIQELTLKKTALYGAGTNPKLSECYTKSIAALTTVGKIKNMCLTPGLRGDGFEDEILDTMSEYLDIVGEEWE